MSKIPMAPVESVAQADALCDHSHDPPPTIRDDRRGSLRARPPGPPRVEHLASIMGRVTDERRRVDDLPIGGQGTVAGGIAEPVHADERTRAHGCSGCQELGPATGELTTGADAATLALDGERLPLTLTVEEAGQLLGISRTAAYRAAKRAELPVVQISGRLHVPTAKLLRLLGIEHPCGGPGMATS